MSNRVVVTGLGLVTPIGIGKSAFFDALADGVSAGVRMDEVEDQLGGYPLDLEGIDTKVGAPVLGFDPSDFIDRKQSSRLTRSAQFGVAAAKLALDDARLEIEEGRNSNYKLAGVPPQQVGVILATGIGGIESFQDNYSQYLDRGPRQVSPFFAPQFMPNSVCAAVSIYFGLEGFSTTTVSACASSSHSIGLAADLLRQGRGSVALAGGTESVLTPLIFAAFSKVRATTTRNDRPRTASRPFDKNRDGFLPAEGAGVVVLETLNHARDRGASILAEFKGFGMSSDAYHVTAPDPDGKGARRSMERALEDSEMTPDDVDYVNAHGTSTGLNDEMETKAIKDVFGSRATEIAVSSTKSQLGHLMGASGAVEAAACVFALRKNLVPPTINYETPDPECDLDYTPNKPVPREVNLALSNSFGFGGHNGTVCLAKFEEEV